MVKKSLITKTVRWSVQLVFLGLFIYLFIQTQYKAPFKSPQLFFKFDPLILLITSIAYRTIIAASLPALITLAATLLLGRFFCGFVCPLGTTIDIFDTALSRVSVTARCRATDQAHNKPAFSKTASRRTHLLKNLKYLILLFLILTAVLGSSFLHFFDPLVIFERSLTLILFPIITYFAAVFFIVNNAIYTETLIALAIFLLIISTGFMTERFWCKKLCPFGGILALVSKISLFRFTFHENCSKCGLCTEICPTEAIDWPKEKIDSAECINCFKCEYECPTKTIKYGFNFKPTRVDLTRRQLITTLVMSLVAVPLSRSLLHRRLEGRLLRPPGSVPETDFMNVCIHCGKCMKVCPTNGLQPCVLEAGVNGFWTPRLVPRIGGCEKNCNRCGQVCPTTAVRNLSLEEKSYAKIGTAVIDRSRCIAWDQNKVCLICDEACQYNAISSLNETVRGITLLRPFVDKRICLGCGVCESRCPLEGRSAIEVYAIGEERKKMGSYVTAEKRELREFNKLEEDIPSGFITE